MSFQQWEVHGYGIRVEDGIMLEDITWEKITKLCQMAPNVHAQFSEDLRNYVAGALDLEEEEYPSYEKALQLVEEHQLSLDDFFDTCDLDFYEEYGINGYLKNVINECEGIDLECVDDEDNYHYIMLVPRYPWRDTNEKMKNLTEDSLCEIFKKYIGLFTDKEVEIDYHRAQNWG